jgi:fumarylacetoacetate (FAA) hydrolase
MKLASLRVGRDGRLVVVSTDLALAVEVPRIAPTLQAALDDWDRVAPKLQETSERLNSQRDGFAFRAEICASPLPRAYQWADGSAYVTHVELVRKARGAELPASFWTDPLIYQGGSDGFLGPTDPIEAADEDWGIDVEGEVAVITGDVPYGCSAAEAQLHIRLVMLANDVSLRNLTSSELAKGFGFFQSKPATAFSPVAVTPDELDDAWHEGRVHLPLLVDVNGTRLGGPHAGTDMTFSFPQLIAHAAKTRALAAGSIIGSGTVSNKDRSVGSACLAEKRMLEQLETGAPKTPFLKFGDSVRIEMLDKNGHSIFGAIDQRVRRIGHHGT